jgi:PAS domain S-box-containing protein
MDLREQVLDALPWPVLVLAPTGRTLALNRAAREALGVPPDWRQQLRLEEILQRTGWSWTDGRAIAVEEWPWPAPGSPRQALSVCTPGEGGRRESVEVGLQAIDDGVVVTWDGGAGGHREEDPNSDDTLRYRLLFDHSFDAVFLTRPDGTIRQANEAACRLFRMSEEELRRASRAGILVHDQSLTEALEARSRSGRVRAELTFIRGDGSRFPGDTTSVVISEAGREPRAFVIVRDLSDVRRAEEAVRERNEYIETVLENAPIGFAVNTIDDGVARFVSRRFERIYGLEPGSLHSVDEFFEKVYRDPRTREQARSRLMADIASGDPARMVWENQPLRLESGETRYISATNIPLPEKNLMVSTALDVTPRVQAEEAAREGERRFQSLVEAANEAIFVQVDERFAYVNEATVRLFGADDAASLLGKPVVEHFHPACRDVVRGRIRRLNEERKPVPLLEEAVLRPDGSAVTVEVTASPIFYAGRSGAVVFARDVGERKRLEAQLLQAQRLESVGRLAGGVAHDFNNMLSVILGYAELRLSMMSEGDPGRGDLEEIMNAARRSAGLTRQLLAFAGRQVLVPRVLNLNECVSNTLRMLERLIGEDVTLEWKPGEALWSVRIDPSQVDQLLANLVVNARDAMPKGGRITLETANEVLDERSFAMHHPHFIPGEYVRLAVSDTGVGMPPEVVRRVFEPFFTTKPAGQGTGLGLATVYGIATQHSGLIDLDSQPGVGTRFVIWFPRREDAAVEPSPAPPPAVGASQGTETVLVVEDSESILKLARTMLALLGYRVLPAGTAVEALAMAQRYPEAIDLLITDVVMPGMSGRELAEQLRTGRPELKVLYMSGYAADVISRHGVSEERVEFLPKPFTLTDLATAVRSALDH